MFLLQRTRIADLAARSHLPAIYGLREHVDAGGLLVYGASLHEAHGAVIREYETVPDALGNDTDELAPWFERARDDVAGLKPKPTKRAR